MATRRRVPPKSKRYLESVEGRFEIDDDGQSVVWVIEATGARVGFGIATGGVVDARLHGKKVRVTVEELG